MIHYSYDDYKKDIDWIGLSVKVYEDEVTSPGLQWSPTFIIAIARGGAIPGVYLSHYLSRPVKIITWQLRDGNYTETPISFYNRNHQLLIVDDINDSGETFTQVLNDIHIKGEVSQLNIRKNIKTAALYERKNSKFKVDICPNRINSDHWIQFPWESP